MKLCIPVNVPNGLESLVEPDLPHAEHLLYFDTDSRLCEEISLSEQETGAGWGIKIHSVLCGSVNRITLQTLTEQGIKLFATEAPTVAQAIAQYENGELDAAVAEAILCGAEKEHGKEASGCGGQRDRHDSHGHENGGCCGRNAGERDAVPEKRQGDVLKIAVSSQNRKTVTEHAGKCRKFWIYDVKQGQVMGRTLLELPIEQSLHATPVGNAHPLDVVNVLITTGMGSGLQQRLLERGIQGVVTMEENPDQAVAAYLAGEIDQLPPNRTWINPCSLENDNVDVCNAAPE